jgi:hypothetical protein
MLREHGDELPGAILDHEGVLEESERSIGEAQAYRLPGREVVGGKIMPILAARPADVVADELLKSVGDRPRSQGVSGV